MVWTTGTVLRRLPERGMIAAFMIRSSMRRYIARMPRFPVIAFIGAALLAVALLRPATAQSPDDGSMERGPGPVVPLADILATSRRLVPGEVIDVELEYDVSFDDDRRDGRWVYEVELLTDDDRIVELEFDARTGQLLEVEGAPWPADVPRPKP